MCGDCGCDIGNAEFFDKKSTRSIHLELDVLEKNNKIAHDNHHWFDDHKVLSLNLMSSPGSGKTRLLEETIKRSSLRDHMAILVGDQQTDHDAKRLENVGGKAKQITTYSSCHLDASMIQNELNHFVTDMTKILFIENVGNLVCPSAFDLGESKRIALLSLPEGEDKPIKYPVLFNKADVILLTKMDLAPYIKFDFKKCESFIRSANTKAPILRVSSENGDGIAEWLQLLEDWSCV